MVDVSVRRVPIFCQVSYLFRAPDIFVYSHSVIYLSKVLMAVRMSVLVGRVGGKAACSCSLDTNVSQEHCVDICSLVDGVTMFLWNVSIDGQVDTA